MVWLLVLAMLGALVGATGAAAGNVPGGAPQAAARESPLPVLPGLKTPFKFWKDIFATYSTRQVVIHDTLHLDRVYEVLDFRPLGDGGFSDADIDAYAKEKVRSEKERVRAILIRLHQLGPNPPELSSEERKIWSLFTNVKEASKFLHAAAEDRIRGQAGLRERFAGGVEVSRRYLPEMEAIFRQEGLPVELTRLPLVESCFNVRAYSKAGAAGIWQFMPATGRLYMRIDYAVDERRDPIVSTTGAAQYLKANYNLLGNWPLAITAYNHGRAGVAHAVATVGSSDLVKIIRHYHGPAFKFASRNFYAEFLAALEVERHFDEYFGGLYAHQPVKTDSVVVPDYVSFKALARATSTDEDSLADLNPALAREVIAGKLHIPKGYRVRVPAGTASDFGTRYASLPAGEKHSTQRALYITHRVKRGQTLVAIAKQYGTTVAAIKRSNNLRNTGWLRAGQNLLIPTG